MKGIMNTMLSSYDFRTERERNHAVRAVMQEMILYCLSKTDFFSKASFMGGTSLRIFHGLGRFSEDLDFSLDRKESKFSLDEYLDAITKGMSELGIDVESKAMTKNIDTTVDTGVVQTHTKELYLSLFPEGKWDEIYGTQLTRIKIEVDTDPPEGSLSERKYRLLPFPFSVSVHTLPTLFAGKMHAVLCREWENRTKGRDLYDLLFYIGRSTKLNMRFLENKLRCSGYDGPSLDRDSLLRMLYERYDIIDYDTAKMDVERFIMPKEKEGLNEWCAEFFKQVSANIRTDR